MRVIKPLARRFLRSRTSIAVFSILIWTAFIALDVSDVPVFGARSFAQADPCATPQGYLQICCPKPCPVTDAPKLGTEITKLTAEISKLTSMLQQATSWMTTLTTIGQSISKLLALFSSMGGMHNSITGLTSPAAVTLPQTMAGAALTDITALKNGLTKLFTLPQAGAPTQILSDRNALTKDSSLTAIATGLNGRSAQQNNMTALNTLAAIVAKATNAQEDLAAGSALRIAMLKSLQTTSQSNSTLLQLSGVQALMALGADASQLASLFNQLSSSPYAASTPTVPTPVVTTELTSTTNAMSAGVIATDNAIDLHNALAASQEMQAAVTQTQVMQQDYVAKVAAAQSLSQALVNDLVPYYANPSAVAAAITAATLPQITATWPDSADRTSQETSATSAIATEADTSPNSLGQFICVNQPVSSGSDVRGGTETTISTPTCEQQVGAIINADLYAVLDSTSQANWYQQFYEDAQTNETTLQSEIANLSTVQGIDVTDTTAVNAVIAADVATATQQFSLAQTDPNMSDGTLASITNAQAGLQSIASDPTGLTYISYDSANPPTPTSAALQNLTPQ